MSSGIRAVNQISGSDTLDAEQVVSVRYDQRNIALCAQSGCLQSGASAKAGVGIPPVAMSSRSRAPYGSVVICTSSSCSKLGQLPDISCGGWRSTRMMYCNKILHMNPLR
jgi:hypothetical protein